MVPLPNDNRFLKNKPNRTKSNSPTSFMNRFAYEPLSNFNIFNNHNQSTQEQSPTTHKFNELSLNSPTPNQLNNIKNKRTRNKNYFTL